MKIKAERNCYDQELDLVLACSPSDLVVISAIDFVYVVWKQKPRKMKSFDAAEIVKIMDEHKELEVAVVGEPSMKAELEKVAKKSFNQACEPAGHRFPSLRRFAAGLVSAMPTTSRVEGDLLFINYRKDE